LQQKIGPLKLAALQRQTRETDPNSLRASFDAHNSSTGLLFTT